MKDKIRVGYISDEFCLSPMLPLLVSFFGMHDSDEFEVIGYMTGTADTLTEGFREASDEWRDISKCGDETVADVIRRDALDILVDISENGVSEKIFWRRPAPCCLFISDMAQKLGGTPYV
ncbi:MAG: hypothetical protein IIU21_03235, partial [Schwartzia sp.]|nr:hypothetical protein [Schwartzia sp. (in: firmicutes)]